ncbi:hypothetical protein RIF29_24394 [Crotalaria pallida]|uniref:Histidine-containing phosphotransfer protein n=1 Tax=Crotalaria pallida TaxID=3830 RepID=A0AAN9EKA3_CROPI
MDSVIELQRKLVEYTSSLIQEGILDDQFTQLKQLQDESNPSFVVDVLTVYFKDSENQLNEVEKALGQKDIDFKTMDYNIHKLKGGSSSIGAPRVMKVCLAFKIFCKEENTEGCLATFEEVKQEYSLVKSKLETLLEAKDEQVARKETDEGEDVGKGERKGRGKTSILIL